VEWARRDDELLRRTASAAARLHEPVPSGWASGFLMPGQAAWRRQPAPPDAWAAVGVGGKSIRNVCAAFTRRLPRLPRRGTRGRTALPRRLPFGREGCFQVPRSLPDRGGWQPLAAARPL